MANEILARGAGMACNGRDEAVFSETIRRLLDDDEGTRRTSVNAFGSTSHLGSMTAAWIATLIAA